MQSIEHTPLTCAYSVEEHIVSAGVTLFSSLISFQLRHLNETDLGYSKLMQHSIGQ